MNMVAVAFSRSSAGEASKVGKPRKQSCLVVEGGKPLL